MKREKWIRIVAMLLVLGLLVPAAFSMTAMAAQATPVPEQMDGNENAYSETPEDAHWLAEPSGDRVQLFNFSASIPTSPVIAARSDTTYAQLQADIAALQKAYPGKIEVSSIGKSVQGRTIPVLRIGEESAKYHILVQAGMHAREYLNPNLVLRQVDLLLSAPDREIVEGKTAAQLVQDVCLHIVPMANPDGVTISQTRTPLWKANANGVDLNVQFPANWEALGGASKPGSENYKGTAPLSEPESSALAAYTLSYDFDVTISYHSMGQCIYWHYPHSASVEAQCRSLVDMACTYTGYREMGKVGNTAAGGFKDWAIGKLGIPSLTIETGSVVCPLPQSQCALVWKQNADLLGYLCNWVKNNRSATGTNMYTQKMDVLREFVTRAYETCLERKPDAEGLAFWSMLLYTRTRSGADVLKDIVLSDECKGRDLAPQTFVQMLYRVCLDREPDAEGLAFWSGRRKNGYPDEWFLRRFIDSDEFHAICKDYGVDYGVLQGCDTAVDRHPQVADFMERLYELCLKREAEFEGVEWWTDELASGRKSAALVATLLMTSDEFQMQKLTPEQTVRMMYPVLMEREADADGLAYWTKKIQTHGMTWVVQTFATCDEFVELCAKYGVKPF